MRKSRKVLVLLILVAILIGCAVGGYSYIWNLDQQEHAGVNIQLKFASENIEQIDPGQTAEIAYSIYNSGYESAKVQEVVVLSLFDKQGQPLSFDSMSSTQAAFEVLSQENVSSYAEKATEKLGSIFSGSTKVVQGNQLVYPWKEYELCGAPQKYKNPFIAGTSHIEEADCKNTYDGKIYLLMDSAAQEKFCDAVIQIDILLIDQERFERSEGSFILASGTIYVSNGNPLEVLSGYGSAPVMPVLNATEGLAWEIHGETAWVTGIGSAMETDIVIPSSISLSCIDALNYRIIAADVRSNGYFRNIGNDYAIQTEEGIVIDEQAQLMERNVIAKQLLVYNVKSLSKYLRGTEFPEFFVSTIDGTVIHEKNVSAEIDVSAYSKNNPLVLIISPKQKEVLVEDPFNGVDYPVVVSGNAFAECDLIKTVTFQDGVTILDNKMIRLDQGMFTGCSNLEMVYNIPQSVLDMEDAFMNCVSMVQMPEIPTSVTSMGDTFQGCTSLKVFSEIPDSVTNMNGCFAGCIAMVRSPELSSSVQNIGRCFSGCVNLEAAPAIPKTVTDMRHTFSNCSSLAGSITIANETVTNRIILQLESAFDGCDKLDCIYVDYCEAVIETSILNMDLPLVWMAEHEKSGVCDGCHTITSQTEVDGLAVEFDMVPEAVYEDALDCLDQEVPDCLKDSCSKLTFTNDIHKYDSSKRNDNTGGLAFRPSGKAYIVLRDSYDVQKATIIHELAHCYDFNFTSHGRYSGSAEWGNVYVEEGVTLESKYGGFDLSLPKEERKMETYAEAVERYFSDPGWLMDRCPQAYEYVAKQFG